MILRPCDTLARKISVRPTESLPLNANPFADWSCVLFRAARVQYILAANTASLYAVLFPGRRITRDALFESALFGHLQEHLFTDGFEFLYKRLIDSEGAQIQYSRPLNAATTGALQDLAELATFYLEADKLPPGAVADKINRSPLSAIGHAPPHHAFRALSFQR